ncbi:MAG: T9SS type A sorting domain-containing protein [Ignavibacteriae bacterium]|nr:T9SS C-terminal target domain-containing protein [Ignavibacteriota bacterium]NOG97611.1 T9SS type A sorting domain-containing protein [Ignavibacteriota bacterium]
MKGKFLLLFFILTSSLNFSQVLYWQDIGDFLNVRDIEIIDENLIFLSQSGNGVTHEQGIFRSFDLGVNWDTLKYLHYPFNPAELAFDKENRILYYFESHSPFMYKSLDSGETWTEIQTDVWKVKYSVIADSGKVIIGSEDGFFGLSLDHGNSWTHFSLPEGSILDMEINSENHLYVVADNKVKKTTNYGTDWIEVYDSSGARDIAIDKNDDLYIISGSDILASFDQGLTWANLNFPEYFPNIIEIDPQLNVYVGDNWYDGLFKKEIGNDWEYIGLDRVRLLEIYDSSKIFAVSIDSEAREKLFLYDSEAIPYVSKTYIPLKVGNKWERFYRSYAGMDPIYNYSISISAVYADTTIGEKKYYKVSGLSNIWVRYDDSLHILYRHYSPHDFVFIDFNKLPGETYYSYRSPTDSSLYEVIASTENLFGQSVNCKGFKVSEWPSVQTYLFAENFGFYKSTYSGFDFGNSNSLKTIQAILINEVNDTTYYPHNYYPEFSIEPINMVINSEFNLDFQVDHEYTKFFHHVFFPDGGINYIGKVLMDFFYQKGSNITDLDSVFAFNTPLTTDYSIQMDLDSTLLNSGYELKYRLTATEIGILPKSTTVPDTGWYTCIYDNTVSVEDETNNLPHQFSLAQNYPNPFNPTTTISYEIAEESLVNITVFDVLGRKVAALVNENKSAGNYGIEFNAERFNSGIYFYQINAGSFREVKKMLFLK